MGDSTRNIHSLKPPRRFGVDIKFIIYNPTRNREKLESNVDNIINHYYKHIYKHPPSLHKVFKVQGNQGSTYEAEFLGFRGREVGVGNHRNLQVFTWVTWIKWNLSCDNRIQLYNMFRKHLQYLIFIDIYFDIIFLKVFPLHLRKVSKKIRYMAQKSQQSTRPNRQVGCMESANLPKAAESMAWGECLWLERERLEILLI